MFSLSRPSNPLRSRLAARLALPALWLAAGLLALPQAQARAQTDAKLEPAWSHPLAHSLDIVWDLALQPDRGRALAVVARDLDYELMAFDLATGAVMGRHAFDLPDAEGRLIISTFAATEDHVVLLGFNDAVRPRVPYLYVLDPATLGVRHIVTLPDSIAGDYNPSLGGATLAVTGDHALFDVALIDRFEDTDPRALHVDLATGKVRSVLSRNDVDPEAPTSFFGRPKATPDYYFANMVAAEGKLIPTPMLRDTPQPVAHLVYDLESGTQRGHLPNVDGGDRFARLTALSGDDGFYVITPPLATQSKVTKIGELRRYDIRTGTLEASYLDPFAPERDLSMSDFISEHLQTGQKPYAGSWFPERSFVTPRHVVATAPNAPMGAIAGAGAVIVYDRERGTPITLLSAPNPGRDTYFGRVIAAAGRYVLLVDDNGTRLEQDPPQQIHLYSLPE